MEKQNVIEPDRTPGLNKQADADMYSDARTLFDSGKKPESTDKENECPHRTP